LDDSQQWSGNFHAENTETPMPTFDKNKNQRLDFREYVNAVNYMLQHEHK
jgi:hypothetical protein